MIAFRHADPRFPFLWGEDSQPPGRWHGAGEGPVHYLADTPDGAWAEFLRHEEISVPEDVAEVRRALWAVEVGDEPEAGPRLARKTLTGGLDTYGACQKAARRLRSRGAAGLVAPSAALVAGGDHGWRVENGVVPGPPRDGKVIVLFGRRPDLVGWAAASPGRPDPDLLVRVRPLRGA